MRSPFDRVLGAGENRNGKIFDARQQANPAGRNSNIASNVNQPCVEWIFAFRSRVSHSAKLVFCRRWKGPARSIDPALRCKATAAMPIALMVFARARSLATERNTGAGHPEPNMCN